MEERDLQMDNKIVYNTISKRIKALALSIFLSFFFLGTLNLITLNMNDSNISEMQTKVLLKYDLKVQKFYGVFIKPMQKVETFYIYNYFDGLFKKYNFKNKSEESTTISLYKKAILPISGLFTFMVIFIMITNALRFGQLSTPSKDH